MREQQAAAVVAGGVAERSRHTRDLIGELKAIRKELEQLRPQRLIKEGLHHSTDGTISDACEALEARELEVRNELRKLQGKPPLVPVQRQNGWEQFTGGSHTELVEQEPDEPPDTDEES